MPPGGIVGVVAAVAAALLVLVIPGAALLVWFPKREQSTIEYFAEAAGLSISLSALAALFGFLSGVRLSGAGWVAVYLGLLLVLGSGVAWRIWGSGRARWENPGEAGRAGEWRAEVWLWIGLGAVLAWRFYQARALVLPAWVDALHHVLIVQVILQNGGLPQDLQPYMPVPFYYHYGFHVLAAAFSRLGELPAEQAVLWLGQILNGLVSLSIYKLLRDLRMERLMAGGAALLAGFVLHMPGYYLTWGRYTLLTGLVVLPLAMGELEGALRAGPTRGRLLRLAIYSSGIFLTHYFAGLLLGIFGLAAGLAVSWERRREGKAFGWALLLASAALLAGLLLAGPWLLRMYEFAREGIGVRAVAGEQPSDTAGFQSYGSYLWGLLGPKRNQFIIYLAGLGLAAGFFERRMRPLVLWGLALALMSLPWGLRVKPFRPDHFVIVLFLPASVGAAYFFHWALGRIDRGRLKWLGRGLGSLAMAGLLVWGIKETATILHPMTVLAGPADARALQWIEQNTPEDAKFFINVAPWQYGAYRGVDGGWWIEVITGRQVLLPASFYNLGPREYVQRVNEVAAAASRVQGCSEEFLELLEKGGYSHLYLNGRSGALRAEALAGCHKVELIYQEENISIYEVID